MVRTVSPKRAIFMSTTPHAPSNSAFTEITPSGISGVNAFALNMVVLPTGQVLMSDEGAGFQIYTEDQATGPQAAWQPTITSVTTNTDGSLHLTGTQLNGLSEGSSYGDDNQSATNYPIVQVTDSSGNIAYARTFNWSTTQVATGTTSESTDFTLPPVTVRRVTISVIANGIASKPVALVVGSSANDTVTLDTFPLGLPLVTVDLNGTTSAYFQFAIAGVFVLTEGKQHRERPGHAGRHADDDRGGRVGYRLHRELG